MMRMFAEIIFYWIILTDNRKLSKSKFHHFFKSVKIKEKM